MHSFLHEDSNCWPAETHDLLDGVRRNEQGDVANDARGNRAGAALRLMEQQMRRTQEFPQEMLESFQQEAQRLQEHRVEIRRM